jgi:probable rRNA maturation factor
MKRAIRPAIAIDIIVASTRWKNPKKAKSVLRRAVTRAAAATRSTLPTEIAIVLSNDSAIRVLNRDWRGIDAATNVLSFPVANIEQRTNRHLGDVILAFETIAREARSEGKPFDHHLAHLGVHGFLHLIGYDHEHEDEAAEMEETERDILHQLDIPDPYRDLPPGRAKPDKTAKLRRKAPTPGARKRRV